MDTSATEHTTPSQIGSYRIERQLANGAMGPVYLAQSPTSPGPEVLKVLRPELAADPTLLARFNAEFDVLARLRHPNIVDVHTRGTTDDGTPWIALAYIPGTDAETALRTHGPFAPEQAVHIISQIAQALDAAHRAGVVHRDVKPSNFLLADQDQYGTLAWVVLADFGAAHLDAADDADSAMTATLAYTAPEVIAGARGDARADIYSLGCALWRLLTASRPFPVSDDDPAAMVSAHLDQPPPRLSAHSPWATDDLDAVIATALAKDPADRYRTAAAFADAARAALAAARAAWDEPVTLVDDDGLALAGSLPRRSRSGALGGPTAATADFTEGLPRAQPRRRPWSRHGRPYRSWGA